ncbi:unnamed protein product [Effrenium voratum]|uniref:Uncharacterized protein n=1 Tax=Effrenium voratum TaxID=2562239 RepID=A0AA36IJ07_9DINO|nr:unnamed protein product [Effrenium voratum]
MRLDEGSELPETLRLTFRDEHPLMQGSANVAALLQSLSLKGSLSLRQTLPMRRKRDLLQLPVADLHFNCALCLEEDTSFMDDGNATVRFQDVQCSAQGRLWSEGEESLLAKASVSTSGVLAAAVRAASLVQALIEAETAAARLSGARSADVFAARSARETGDEDVQYTSVRVGDVLQVEVGGSANAEALAQLRLSFRNKEETVCSPVSRGRVEADKLTVADMDLDDAYAVEGDDRMPLLRLSIAGSEASIQMGECRAQVGDLALTVPSAKMKLDCVEAEINAEGIGQTHLRATWSGLGQPLLQHTAKQRKILFPQPPESSGLTVRIGDMGQVGIILDDEPDAVACGNKLLDDEEWFSPLLALAAMLNLEPATKKLLNFARVVRHVLRSEGICEPKDVIPTGRMARVIARILQEIGTDGQYVADTAPTSLEQDVYSVVETAVKGKGLDANKITRLLWALHSLDHLPSEACSFVQAALDRIDFAIKWFDSVLKPTEPTSGPGASDDASVPLEEANAEAPRLPAVPQVFNAGADGMPQLPNVERLLADFQDVKQNLNSQASSFAEHLSKVERASLQRIEKQKAVYDAKLREQEKGNQALVRSNAHLAKEIITARQRSAELSKQVGAAEKLVSFRRSELQALDQQLSRADKFVKQTLSATDPEAEDMSKAAKEARPSSMSNTRSRSLSGVGIEMQIARWQWTRQ